MYDTKTGHLGLTLPHEQNDLEDDVLRIRAAFRRLDDFAKTTDDVLAARLAQAVAADDAIATLLLRMSAAELAQAGLDAVQTGHGQTLLEHAAALETKLDGPPTAERPGGIRVGNGLRLETGENGETDVLAVAADELGGRLLLNSGVLITESCEWTAPVEGWYEVLVINAGWGAHLRESGYVYGGRSGATKRAFVYLHAGEDVDVTIGAGGSTTHASSMGGRSSFGDVTPELESNNFAGITIFGTGTNSYGLGGGPGGSPTWAAPPAWYGGGGGGNKEGSNAAVLFPGYQGAVHVCWHDPAKAAGPLPAPALLSARRMAPRAIAEPVVVNLYDPETGQGSVWREEDAEAKLAEGLISEEAWLAICAAKAAEDYAAWLADPGTVEERFELLRMACEAKLAETDKLVQPDYPLSDESKAEVTTYRKAIRELNHQPGAPWDGGGEATPWPEMPAIAKVTA